MSLILDALRKLDREKFFRRERGVNIAREVVRPDIPAPGRRVGIYVFAILLTAGVSAAITYGLISRTLPPVAVESAAPSLEVTTTPFRQEPLRDARKEVDRTPGRPHERIELRRPVEIEKPMEIKKPVEPKEPPAEAKIPAPSVDQGKTGSDVPSKGGLPSAEIRKPPEQIQERAALAPKSLRLSGIVWSEEPTKRLAVINGMVTREGYVFEGVKVVEIYPDHVLLSVNGRSIELSLNK